MNKQIKLEFLLSKLQDKLEELQSYEDENVEQMTAEETLLLAVNLITYGNIEQEYNQPIGIIDRSQVLFRMDDGFELFIGDKEGEYDENED